VGTCKTKHPERAKGITVDFGGTPVGGFKRTQLARVVGVMQPAVTERLDEPSGNGEASPLHTLSMLSGLCLQALSDPIRGPLAQSAERASQ
jgi:hypothetical protein